MIFSLIWHLYELDSINSILYRIEFWSAFFFERGEPFLYPVLKGSFLLHIDEKFLNALQIRLLVLAWEFSQICQHLVLKLITILILISLITLHVPGVTLKRSLHNTIHIYLIDAVAVPNFQVATFWLQSNHLGFFYFFLLFNILDITLLIFAVLVWFTFLYKLLISARRKWVFICWPNWRM